jgi:hypothetical protein
MTPTLTCQGRVGASEDAVDDVDVPPQGRAGDQLSSSRTAAPNSSRFLARCAPEVLCTKDEWPGG